MNLQQRKDDHPGGAWLIRQGKFTFASSYLILLPPTWLNMLRKSLASLVLAALAAVLLQTASALSTVKKWNAGHCGASLSEQKLMSCCICCSMATATVPDACRLTFHHWMHSLYINSNLVDTVTTEAMHAWLCHLQGQICQWWSRPSPRLWLSQLSYCLQVIFTVNFRIGPTCRKCRRSLQKHCS